MLAKIIHQTVHTTKPPPNSSLTDEQLQQIFETFDAEVECAAVGIDPGLFRTMTEEEFRMDISSSELRAKGHGLSS